MKKKPTRKQAKSEASLDDVKRLLMLLLLKIGASQKEIATALGVDQSVVSRMFPAKGIKKLNG